MLIINYNDLNISFDIEDFVYYKHNEFTGIIKCNFDFISKYKIPDLSYYKNGKFICNNEIDYKLTDINFFIKYIKLRIFE